ncbi:RluA family pseudouridine synthase [Secundilactobacillus kimchicus]|uniref:Pseudouridine synthase n=1 Tax=Secundilactobacillus kimchicus JCM 15530 TaxID=1302272 RepID=A0A0R1HST0_9LACO|nr:RluA family pseudouridine synthase [Secundilactobacillus kimchicus]KRK49339.1 ribosomal large subunit pseudouridine synthase D [Secundilactobacillus kimchicus JCM 15530]MBT9672885.1 RluA family pseudouridine synthase [Secundilactobacillus kimchicus]
MTETTHFTITTEQGRIDKVLETLMPNQSRSQLKQAIEAKLVRVADHAVKPSYRVASGDVITVTIPDPVALDLEAEDIPLDIVYEDEDVIVVNKPAGMVVHPSAGHPNHTLVNALLYHSPLSTINGTFRPGIVHRIDKDTSGLLMVAKNDHAHQSLAKQLKDKTNLREYIALVHGVIKQDTGTIDAPIGRSPKDRKKQAIVADGRHAVTHYRVLERYLNYTLILCWLETGRTHQIRVHMKSIGHPLAGDPLYGPRKTINGSGQFLHAEKLGFKHPTTGRQLVFEAPLPADFQKVIKRLEAQQSPN